MLFDNPVIVEMPRRYLFGIKWAILALPRENKTLLPGDTFKLGKYTVTYKQTFTVTNETGGIVFESGGTKFTAKINGVKMYTRG